MEDYGTHVIIKHADNYFTAYGHMVYGSIPSDIFEGATVTAGQKLGVMGTTGFSTGTHLHFEIRKGADQNTSYYKAEKLDPVNFFNEDCSPIGNNGSSTILKNIVDKAKKMADDGKIRYEQNNRQIIFDKNALDTLTITDNSGFIASLYSSYMGIQIGTNASSILSIASTGNLGNGWSAIVANYNKNINTLQIGDILYKDGTIGIYVGGGKQVILDSTSGPSYKDVDNTYTKYIRYVNTSMSGISIDSIDGIQIGTKVGTLTYQSANKYSSYAQKWGTYYGIDPKLVIAVIAEESGGRINADNGSAIGLMQWEYGPNGTECNTTNASGQTEKITGITKEALTNNADFQIKVGCAVLKAKMNIFNGNIYETLQGYNYGTDGFRRCIGYYLRRKRYW